MQKTRMMTYIFVSMLSALSTILLTSSELFDGLLRREKAQLEIERLREDLLNYKKVVEINLGRIQSETEVNLQNLQFLSETLRPQIDKLNIETKVMRRELDFNSLANDLVLIRDLRPVINVDGKRQQTFGSGRVDFLLLVKNTGKEVVRLDKFSSHFQCDGEKRNAEEFYQNWSLASGDTFKFDPPAMPRHETCGGCEFIIEFVASADPIAIRLLKARYSEMIDEFSDFLEAPYSYRFSC